MPVLLQRHVFTPDAQATRRQRDVRCYRCVQCDKRIRIPMRTKAPEDRAGIANIEVYEERLSQAGVNWARIEREGLAPLCQGTPGAASWGRCEQAQGHPGACTHDPGCTSDVLHVDGPTSSFEYLGADVIERDGQLYRWEFCDSEGKMAYCAVPHMPRFR